MSETPSPAHPVPTQDNAHPILTHERSLANKIAKGSEAGDILDQQLAMLGIQLVTQLNVLIKTSRIHGRTNAALDKPVDSMLTLVKTLAADHPVVLRLQNDFLFLGDSHLKMSSQQMAEVSSTSTMAICTTSRPRCHARICGPPVIRAPPRNDSVASTRDCRNAGSSPNTAAVSSARHEVNASAVASTDASRMKGTLAEASTRIP